MNRDALARSGQDSSGRRLSAWKITAVYATCVSGWILFSDRLVETLGMPSLHTYKGLAFVAISSAVLYSYLRRKVAQHEAFERTLATAAESKTRLVSAVSHDLRQPLQSLALFAAVVESDAALAPQSRLALGKLRQSVDRMGQLLDAMLDLAKLDAGMVRCERKPVAVADVIAALADEMAPQAQAKGLALRWVRTSMVVNSDPILLLTILRNFVANAIRFTDRGTVLIGCRRHGSECVIGVYDTGMGIDPDKLKLVFEEFYQVGNQSRDSRLGLGLGLSVVDRLSRVLGHRILVRSQQGKGSAFCVIVAMAAEQ